MVISAISHYRVDRDYVASVDLIYCCGTRRLQRSSTLAEPSPALRLLAKTSELKSPFPNQSAEAGPPFVPRWHHTFRFRSAPVSVRADQESPCRQDL